MALSMRMWALPLFRLRKVNRDLTVNRHTDIVIEGFPRCANTFTVVAFQQAQYRDVNIAHHLHAPSQIMLAKKLGLPAILLIRDPVDAIVSLKIRHPELDVRRCIRDYIAFYRSLSSINDYPVVADFHDITNHLDLVIEEVNRRYQTHFTKFFNTNENVESVFAEIDVIRKAANRSSSQVATPNRDKEEQKKFTRDLVESSLSDKEIGNARKLYKQFSKQRASAQH